MSDNDRVYCLMSGGKALLIYGLVVPVFTTEEKARAFDRLGTPIVSTPAHIRALTRLETFVDPAPSDLSLATYRVF